VRSEKSKRRVEGFSIGNKKMIVVLRDEPKNGA
jgi:hypothetical protein